MKHVVLWAMAELFGVGKVLKILEVWSLIVLLISSKIRKLAWKDDIKMRFYFDINLDIYIREHFNLEWLAVVLNRFRMSMKTLFW